MFGSLQQHQDFRAACNIISKYAGIEEIKYVYLFATWLNWLLKLLYSESLCSLQSGYSWIYMNWLLMTDNLKCWFDPCGNGTNISEGTETVRLVTGTSVLCTLITSYNSTYSTHSTVYIVNDNMKMVHQFFSAFISFVTGRTTGQRNPYEFNVCYCCCSMIFSSYWCWLFLRWLNTLHSYFYTLWVWAVDDFQITRANMQA